MATEADIHRTGRRRVIPHRRFLSVVVAVMAVVTALGPGRPELAAAAPQASENVVLQWNGALLQGVRESRLGPPMVARALSVAHTCMFDAWAAYDQRAVGTRLGGSLRRPGKERNVANKIRAVSFAAYRAAVDLLPGSKATVFDPLMAQLGYDPADQSLDTRTPTGIGNVACRAVLDFRHSDGSNQLGDEPGGLPGVPYSDYTGYVPANGPMDVTDPSLPLDASTVRDPNRWQPLRYRDLQGNVVTPPFIGPFWNRVDPFALSDQAQFRSPTGPARYGTDHYRAQALAVLEASARLTDRDKAIAEYWADGPRSELPPGHWNLFAQFVSRRDHHGLDDDVRMFFALTNALFDASIVSWDNKIAFDSVRPITAIRYLFGGEQVRAWGGPYRGTRTIDGGTWFPYQPTTFPTPPFAEYSSGHSAFSAAGAEILKLFTGSDRFGDSVVVPAGSSRVEPGAVPASPVTLKWRTFSEAADEAGISRRVGGIHFEQGDLESRATGRLVAQRCWRKAQSYFDGTATSGP